MEIASMVSKWGNSSGIRIPVEILKKANVNLNDKLFFHYDRDY
jgi:antitoxin component of MazEF toxin-antitoxin module